MKPVTVNKQSGAALIVALIMLLVMTIIGISGMNETIMEEQMTFNFRDRAIALNAADSSTRAAEYWLTDQVLTPTPHRASDCSTPPLCGSTDKHIIWDLGQLGTVWNSHTWNWWTTNGISYTGSGATDSTIDYIADQPRIALEFRGMNLATTTNDKGIASNMNPEKSTQGSGWHYYNLYSSSPGYRAETIATIQTTFQKWF